MAQEVSVFDPSVLDGFETPGEVVRYFQDMGIDVTDNKVDGIKSLSIVENKDTLIGVPFLIVSWRFSEGDYGTEFVSAEIMLSDGSRVILNDGGTGICTQLRELTDTRTARGHKTPFAGRMVTRGLRKSEFYYHADTKRTATRIPDGESVKSGWAPATTYYLDF